MSRSLALVAASVLGLVPALTTVSSTASAQVVVDFPSADFVASIQPIYYENHAAYWWHNHWLWRDGGGWHSYDKEPEFLMQHRLHDPAGRWFYGHKDAHGEGNYGHDEHGGHGGHDAVPAHEEKHEEKGHEEKGGKHK
jgi:hypothetical protein